MMQVLQIIIATVIVFSALSLLVLRHPMHCLMAVMVAIMSSAALWLSMGADYLAVILLIMHAGAVMTLFLYVTMTLSEVKPEARSVRQYILLVVLGLLWLGLLLYMRALEPELQTRGMDVARIGLLLSGYYSLTVWVLGLMVTLAMVASIAVIYSEGSALYIHQKPHEQKKVTAAERLGFKTQTDALKDGL